MNEYGRFTQRQFQIPDVSLVRPHIWARVCGVMVTRPPNTEAFMSEAEKILRQIRREVREGSSRRRLEPSQYKLFKAAERRVRDSLKCGDEEDFLEALESLIDVFVKLKKR